ncbi:hypothetical protein JCM10207_000024 [Rhodosporidiobolus poonsookiae]
MSSFLPTSLPFFSSPAPRIDSLCERITSATPSSTTASGDTSRGGGVELQDLAGEAVQEEEEEEEGKKKFDYVVCGGGTAGCVLASRLTEDPAIRVLLVEAGESDQKQLMSRIPAGWGNLFNSDAAWNFDTVPQAALNDRVLYQPRGKMLGGCSAINAQIYQHCSPEDYDLWASLGATGWGWTDLKPYFDKAEKWSPNPEYEIDETKRRTDGIRCTGYPTATAETTRAFVKSGPAVGLPANRDLNDETNTSGITRFQTTADPSGQRASTSAAYLPPAVLARPNLAVLTSTTCTRLIFAPSAPNEPRKVLGVELAPSEDGPRYLACASRDVLVCLGAFGSPQLLLCSGIGRASTLNKAGVQVQVEVEGVGEGMKDHVLVPVAFETKAGSSFEFLKNPVKTLPSLLRWLSLGSGPLASNLAEAAAFLRSDAVLPDGTVALAPVRKAEGGMNASGKTSADLEVITAPVYYVNHGLSPPPAPQALDYMTLAPVVLKPFSSGCITISSGDAFEKPLIDPGYLTDERDEKVLLAGLRVIQRLSRTPPLADLLTRVAAPQMSLDDFAAASEETLLEHTRATAETVYHPMGGCKIGPKDKGGVVSPSLTVHSTLNVRVCDASIFPDAVSGHPQAAVVADAEKFAAMLKAEQSHEGKPAARA